MHEQILVSSNLISDGFLRYRPLLNASVFVDLGNVIALGHLASDKGEKGSEHSATIALQSPFTEDNGRFELGLGQSVVSFSHNFVYAYE